MVPPDLGLIEDGLIAAKDGVILYAGPADEAPHFEGEEIDCEGRWITPGLIDCHTHLVYGGSRIGEFEERLTGKSYAEIAGKGGGIRSTMRATHQASEGELIATALPRLDALMAEGVTTLEIKSGYGLSLDDEIKQLRAARALGSVRPVALAATYLAAHVPPAESSDADGFIEDVCRVRIPRILALGLAEAVDAYCDTMGFSRAQCARVLEAARAHGLAVKLHAEQFSNQNGATLAAKFGALSADHLEYLDGDGAAALAGAGTVAVLLPGAYYFMRQMDAPPVALLRQAGVPIAIATDCNPGTSPLTSPLLAMNMAATFFRLTVTECLLGMTRHAALALGRGGQMGMLARGLFCDLAIWSIEQPAELVYRMGFNPLHVRIWRGK